MRYRTLKPGYAASGSSKVDGVGRRWAVIGIGSTTSRGFQGLLCAVAGDALSRVMTRRTSSPIYPPET